VNGNMNCIELYSYNRNITIMLLLLLSKNGKLE